MKDIISLLLTTTCLAVAGLGIYFFSYKTDDENDNTQKNIKKKTSNGGKKIVETEIEQQNNDGYNDNNSNNHNNHNNHNNDNNDNIERNDNIDMDHYKNAKPKTSKSASKTKRNKNRFATSKKRYYY